MDKNHYLKIIEPVIALVTRKAKDYNGNEVQLHEYFPFGDKSYVQMLHTKVLRLRSLVGTQDAPNYESVEDTVMDLINYAVFYLEYLQASDK